MAIQTSVNISSCSVSNLPINLESANTISIDIQFLLREEVAEDENGQAGSYQATILKSSHVKLKPRNLTGSCLSQLLVESELPDYIGEEIALGIERSLSNDPSLREPFFVSLSVVFLETRSRSASLEVFRRLMEEEEHRVASRDLKEDKTCSICIDGLSENNGDGDIVKMPGCLHMFHQGCLFEWLCRQNSCPSCRKVPFEEEDQEAQTPL